MFDYQMVVLEMRLFLQATKQAVSSNLRTPKCGVIDRRLRGYENKSMPWLVVSNDMMITYHIDFVLPFFTKQIKILIQNYIAVVFGLFTVKEEVWCFQILRKAYSFLIVHPGCYPHNWMPVKVGSMSLFLMFLHGNKTLNYCNCYNGLYMYIYKLNL